MMNSAVFLPWRGEFGMLVLRVVRRIHAFEARHKQVYTKPGLEALFPSCGAFSYDWEDVPDAKKGWRLKRDHEHQRYMSGIMESCKTKFPDSEIVLPTSDVVNSRAWNFVPAPGVKRGIAADIVIAPRLREHAPKRNFQHWQRLVDEFNANGLTVAAIGDKNTSVQNLKGLKHCSWDFDPLNAGIELLQNCMLAVMTDSGAAHLAVLCGAPLKVIYDQPEREIAGRGRWYLDEMRALAVSHCEPITHGWNAPEKVVKEVGEYLAY